MENFKTSTAVPFKSPFYMLPAVKLWTLTTDCPACVRPFTWSRIAVQPCCMQRAKATSRVCISPFYPPPASLLLRFSLLTFPARIISPTFVPKHVSPPIGLELTGRLASPGGYCRLYNNVTAFGNHKKSPKKITKKKDGPELSSGRGWVP